MNELLWSLLAQGSQRCVPGAVCKLETQKIFYFPLVHINRKVGTTLVAQWTKQARSHRLWSQSDLMSNSYSSFFSSFSRILQNFNQHFVTFDISILITVLACDELFCWVGSYGGLGGGVRNVTKQTGWQVSSLITYRVFKQTVTSVPIDHTAQTLNTKPELYCAVLTPHPAASSVIRPGRQ